MEDKIMLIASELLGCEISENTAMKDVPKWDSIKTLQIIMALEEDGISVPLEKIAKIKSINDIISFAEVQEV